MGVRLFLYVKLDFFLSLHVVLTDCLVTRTIGCTIICMSAFYFRTNSFQFESYYPATRCVSFCHCVAVTTLLKFDG